MKSAILFITGGLGDNLLSIPLILELEKRVNLTIVVPTGPQEKFFCTCFPELRIIPFSNDWLSVVKIWLNGIFKYYWLYSIGSCNRKLRLLNLLSFAREKYGFTALSPEKSWQSEIGLSLCLVADLGRKAWKNNLRLLTLIDEKFNIKKCSWDFYAQELKERIFKSISLTVKNKWDIMPNSLLIHAGSNKYIKGIEKYRRWPVENYINLSKLLLENKVFNKIYWLVGPAEEDLMSMIEPEIEKSSKMEIIHYSQFNGNIIDLFVVLTKMRYFLSNDTGIAHLASFTGIPMTVIFSGMSQVYYTAQEGKETQIIWEDIECRGCTVGFSPVLAEKFICHNNGACIKDIAVERVYRAISEHLKKIGLFNG
jgi:ADP-heptose:LPS heptosyltransferase